MGTRASQRANSPQRLRLRCQRSSGARLRSGWVRSAGPAGLPDRLVVTVHPYGERGKGGDPRPGSGLPGTGRPICTKCAARSEFLDEGGLAAFHCSDGRWLWPGTGPELSRTGSARSLRFPSHVAAAFRLPSEDEAGEPLFLGRCWSLICSFLRSRGGELEHIGAGNQSLVRGNISDDGGL